MLATRRVFTKPTVPIVAAVTSALFAVSVAAAAETVTVCQVKGTNASVPSGRVDIQLSRLLALSTDDSDADAQRTITLTRDERGFDLVLNWHRQDEHSLRAQGRDILGMELGNLVHLMVAGDQGRVEEYLFDLNEDGSGDLLWNTAVSRQQDNKTAKFACTKPR